MNNEIKFKFGIDFEDLYNVDGLLKIDKKFNNFLQEKNPNLFLEILDFSKFNQSKKSNILIELAKILEDFLAEFFDIEKENQDLKKRHENLQKIHIARKEFSQRIVAKKFDKNSDLPSFKDVFQKVLKIINFNKKENQENHKNSFYTFEEEISDFEEKFAIKILNLISKGENLSNEEKDQFDLMSFYGALAIFSNEGKLFHQDGSLFKLPQKINPENLIKENSFKKRDGFEVNDCGYNLNQSLSEAHYCIFCHNQEKDSCRKGLKDKHEFKKDIFDLDLKGCPLDQKISEMNFLKSEGFSIASLAIAIIDNPMLAGTGHRICNDCMKSCIFQKQDPVNIPQIESENLKDVLILPFGFEIYSLLTRWNPLNFEQKIAKPNSGKKILVAGLGPAGYTLSHYLLNQGHVVVAIDGLKIEPLNPEISGIDQNKNRVKFKPIKFIDEIYEPLSNRLIQGFGGVAEYGITSRWNKNFLTIIRLLLERRENFTMFGGIRFGSSIDDMLAFEKYGFDHISLCIGAGRPNIINLKNNYAKGIRAASDFLMSLQLNGAFRNDLLANLQIRMPIIVIGGGLTAIDCACEAQEYYFSQIKKISELAKNLGKEAFFANLNDEEKIIAEEFLQDYLFAKEFGREEFFKRKSIVKILYRKQLKDSPAYKLNHQEIEFAISQGVEFVENANPCEAIIDEFKSIKALKCEDGRIFDCKSLIIAAGTSPNISPVTEDGLNFNLSGKYFAEEKNHKMITKINKDGKAISFFGDLHPSFEGNVVSAMASAKFGYKIIENFLQKQKNNDNIKEFLSKIKNDFLVKIHEINKVSNHFLEIIIHAPLLTNNTKIGQIFRLQNYHNLAEKVEGKLLAMEGVAITALDVNKDQGLISGVITQIGASTCLIQNFKKGDHCIFMGPSGKAHEVPKDENVVLIGGSRGHIPLAIIAEIYKKNNCKIIFFCGYRKNSYIVWQERMEKASDILIYAIDEESPNINLTRSQDRQYKGKVTEAVKKYFLENPKIKIDRIFTIGNDKMMSEVAKLRKEKIIDNFSNAPIAITSLNAPMQCMLKGVCSQCLQKRKNQNNEWEYFYSCASQDQDMDKIDFNHLTARSDQNSFQEKISQIWVETKLS